MEPARSKIITCLPTYENLRRLEESPNSSKFITIRRRGPKIIAELDALPKSKWTTIRVATENGRGRNLQVHKQVILPKNYGKNMRQKEPPA